MFARNMLNIALTSIELINLDHIDINAENAKTDGVITQHQRQTNIAETDNSYQCVSILKFIDIHLQRVSLHHYTPSKTSQNYNYQTPVSHVATQPQDVIKARHTQRASFSSSQR